jgi:ribosome biogenesis GTPase
MKTTNLKNTGMVVAVYQNQVAIRLEERYINCRLASNGRKQKNNHHHDVLVGDWVTINNGMIDKIVDRRNTFSRRKPGRKPEQQRFAANVDQMLAVLSAANPAPKWNLLDRYLASAELAEIPVLICITKMDLLEHGSGENTALLAGLEVYEQLGYDILLTSSSSLMNIEVLRASLAGKSNLLIGKSGVGKSSLMNALYPEIDRIIGEVGEESGKGRHTTSSAWLHVVDENAFLIDTPGTREFGLWLGEPEDLQYAYVDIEPYVGECRFGLSCMHDEEPGCAVRRAVMQGEIHPYRYQSYLKLLDEERAS